MRFVVLSGAEFSPYAQMCVATIRHHHADAVIVHMTDDTTPALDGVDAVWRSAKLAPEGPAFIRERVDLLAKMDAAPTAVLDADTLVMEPLDSVWDAEFDIALTWRPKQPLMPYNMGVMFCRDPAFFAGLGARMDAQPRLAQPFGDQEALAQEAHCGKWRLGVLKCAEWNNSDLNTSIIPAAKILHYKGQRKQYMADHFERGVWK